MKEGCAPLFIACKKGNVEIVEYLITVCNADVEQRGKYEVPEDRSVHNVTPCTVNYKFSSHFLKLILLYM